MPSPAQLLLSSSSIPAFLLLFFVFFLVMIPTLHHASAQTDDSDVYDCIRQADNFDEMTACGDRHIEYWQGRMALAMRQLSGLLSETRRIMLDDSQDVWVEYRIRQTDLSNAIHYSSDDMMHRVLAKIREARIYQQRAGMLEDLIEIEQAVSR